MKALISSAGLWGKETARALSEWLPEVIPAIRPTVLPEFVIPFSSDWQRTFFLHVDSSELFIVCITQDVMVVPDLYFQLGMIAGRKTNAPLYPFFVGVDSSSVPPLLSQQYPCVFADKYSVTAFVTDLNRRATPTPLPEPILRGVVSAKWPSLESTLIRIASEALRAGGVHPIGQETVQGRSVTTHVLSDKAANLLFEAAADPHGTVMAFATLAGRILRTNGKEFMERGNPRSEAEWLAALRELVKAGFLEARGTKGELYAVTADGYRVADEIRTLRK